MTLGAVFGIFLPGGFSGRFGGHGYGHAGIGVPGTILIIGVILMGPCRL